MLRLGQVVFGLVIAVALVRCGTESNPLAPYGGERPLQLLAVTQSFTPQIQWVGGRVAAIGVNRDSTAALDSTLVWMMRADDNAIGSIVTVGDGASGDLVAQYGGTPLDSLEDGGTYTFWIAEREVLDAALDSSSFDGFNFSDTTLTLDLVFNGRSSGGAGVDVIISLEETLEKTSYVVRWTPALPFREIGISRGRVGNYSDLLWHVVLPDSVEDSILPPVVIGEPPPGATEVVDWAGFPGRDFYTYWMVTSDWDGGDFGLRADGLVSFQVFPSNFPEDDEEDGS